MTRTRVLGIETSCDETAAAVVVDGHEVLSSVVSSQVDLHARFGGVVPEIASRAHVELLTPVIARALVEARDRRRPRRRRRRHRRARAHRRPARRRQRGQDPGPGVGRALRGRQPPRGPPLRRPPRGSRARAPGGRAARLGRPHPARADGGPRSATVSSARPSTTPPARPSTRSPATSASATRAVRRSTPSPWRATPTPSAFPRAILDDGYDFSFSGLKTVGRQPRPQAPRRRHRGRRRVVPGGRGRRARHQGPSRRP